MLQLNPPLPVRCPKGRGLAHLVIDYGPEHHLLWTIFITEGAHAGEIWTYANPEVRAETNPTMGRQAVVPTVYIGGKLNSTTKQFDCMYGPSPDRLYILGMLAMGEHIMEVREGKRKILGYMDVEGKLVPWEPGYEI